MKSQVQPYTRSLGSDPTRTLSHLPVSKFFFPSRIYTPSTLVHSALPFTLQHYTLVARWTLIHLARCPAICPLVVLSTHTHTHTYTTDDYLHARFELRCGAVPRECAELINRPAIPANGKGIPGYFHAFLSCVPRSACIYVYVRATSLWKGNATCAGAEVLIQKRCRRLRFTSVFVTDWHVCELSLVYICMQVLSLLPLMSYIWLIIFKQNRVARDFLFSMYLLSKYRQSSRQMRSITAKYTAKLVCL